VRLRPRRRARGSRRGPRGGWPPAVAVPSGSLPVMLTGPSPP
jgi:hypothetical protein